jgi:small-conductance mechanosensitive channel
MPNCCPSSAGAGLRASLITLFSNVGYVLLVLLTLSLLGVKWENLAWIVSALSVGIGFGCRRSSRTSSPA